MSLPSELDRHRRAYAARTVQRAGGPDERLVAAFAAVPREAFLGRPPWHLFGGPDHEDEHIRDPRRLYQDVLVALAPERGINNGQPSLHARCLLAAAPREGDTVVHVGSGTGYYTAILATLVGPGGHVLAIESERDLAARARKALRAYPAVTVRAASATETPIPPCDVLYVSAGVTQLPGAWLDALRLGARLVLPLTTHAGQGLMLLITRTGSAAYAARAFDRVAFIPCVGTRDDAASASLSAALAQRSADEVRSLRRGTAPDATAWCVGRDWWLSTAAPVS